jgi:putative Mg2+ transporter-C (MgtC) family protein
MAWQVFMLRVGVAALLGAVIGLGRQVRQRLAGLRTNALVSIGAAAFVALAAATPAESSPTRVAAQVVSGIGVPRGGVIFREGLSVRGLNTAATLWCSGAVGSLAGSGLYVPATPRRMIPTSGISYCKGRCTRRWSSRACGA